MAKKKYSALEDKHHIVRRCGYQVIERDEKTGQVLGLFPGAMSLRPEIEERYLSVNWLEHCSGAKIDQLKIIVAIHLSKAPSGKLSPKSGVTVLNVGVTQAIGTRHGHRLAIRFTPSATDPSYSRVSGLPLDNSDTLLVAALANEAYKEFYLLKDI